MNQDSPSSGRLSPEQAFERLGRITRQLHEAMTELGFEQSLLAVAQEIPDARDRLNHVAHMTESAANKVLNLVDAAQPGCRQFEAASQKLENLLAQVDNDPQRMSDALATCRMFAQQAEQFARHEHATWSEVMLTQDFQDLSGQILRKVTDIIGQTEQQLLGLLMHSAPEQLQGVRPPSDLAGPQSPGKALAQNDVDDLLASMGF